MYTQNKTAQHICIEDKVIFRVTFNPGLVLTGFRTTRPYFQQSKNQCLVSSQLLKRT